MKILITGSTGQLGQHLAVELASKGHELVLNYRKDKKTAEALATKLIQTARPLPVKGRGPHGALRPTLTSAEARVRQTPSTAVEGAGGGFTIIQADVTNPTEVKKMFKKIGPVDVLINCVGEFIYKPLLKTSEQEFTDCINSNLMSSWNCTKSALPLMRKQKFGRIINFGSAGCDALTARPFTTPYYIAKTGLLMLTRSLARELAGTGVTVNMVSPGVLPHGVKPPGAPIITYDEIANALLFLLQNKNLNGANIEVSKGWRPA